HDSVGRRGTLTSPMCGLTSSGAFGTLASIWTLALAVRGPSGGGVTAVPDTVNVYRLLGMGRVVGSVRGVDCPGDSGFCPNAAVVPGGRLDTVRVTGEVKFGPLTDSTDTV